VRWGSLGGKNENKKVRTPKKMTLKINENKEKKEGEDL
jgi:hypothetical protein